VLLAGADGAAFAAQQAAGLARAYPDGFCSPHLASALGLPPEALAAAAASPALPEPGPADARSAIRRHNGFFACLSGYVNGADDQVRNAGNRWVMDRCALVSVWHERYGLIVGGGKRGVVTTACYIARTFGVRSAMPMFEARRLCPHATIVRPNMDKYAGVSRLVRALMLESGLWTALRTRPYSHVPAPTETPYALYITAIVSLAGLITYLAIRISPTKDRPGKKDDTAPPSDDGAGSGKLFRRAKRGEA